MELASQGKVVPAPMYSQHKFRSQRRHEAKQRKDKENLELKLHIACLKSELEQWQTWWDSWSLDYAYSQKVWGDSSSMTYNEVQCYGVWEPLPEQSAFQLTNMEVAATSIQRWFCRSRQQLHDRRQHEHATEPPSADIVAAVNSLPAKVSPGQAATCIAACWRSYIVRKGVREIKYMILAERESASVPPRVVRLARKCPRGQTRAYKLNQCRLNTHHMHRLMCDLCGRQVSNEKDFSRVHCGRGSACCKDFHVCPSCINELPKRPYDSKSGFL